MSVLDRPHSISDHGAESTRSDSRLVFPPSPTAHGVLDGGWWPRTRDPAAELPALVAAVADRLGVVSRIALNADAWDTRPQRVKTAGPRVVRLDWFGAWDAHTIRLIGCDSAHLDLLMIPPDTATVLALVCLGMVADQDTSANERAGLLPACAAVAPRPAGRPVARSRRAEPGQVSRWETNGGRTRKLT